MAKRRAGLYVERVIILTRSLAAADGVGEEVESWPDPTAGTNEHWAAIDGITGSESVDTLRQSARTITLRFRTEVTLEAVDMIRMKATEEDFTVTGVWRERRKDGPGFQTVCTMVG